jgi:hypothetical protein
MESAITDPRTQVNGWGADLDPGRRPGVPREKTPWQDDGPYGQMPEPQPLRGARILKSVEHARLPPVFGTSCPIKGLSGALRRVAYDRFSEARTAHWALLLVADRIDVLESLLADLLRGKAANPLSEMGLGSELGRGGFFSRFGRDRADVRRQGREALLVAAAAGGALLLFNRSRSRNRTA